MRTTIKIFILPLVLSSILYGCHNEVIKVDRDFIGIWNGAAGTSVYHLSINNRSDGYWEEVTGGVYQYARGIARIKHNELFIGLKEFDIIQSPARDSSGIWTMNLDGIIYIRQ